MHYSAVNAYVPRVERNNRTIKYRVRVIFHRFLYNNPPRILVTDIVTGSTNNIKFFSQKNGVTEYYSPRMIVHRDNLDYEEHCKYSIWDYVEAHDELNPLNTMAHCTLDCINLRPLTNM